MKKLLELVFGCKASGPPAKQFGVFWSIRRTVGDTIHMACGCEWVTATTIEEAHIEVLHKKPLADIGLTVYDE